MKQETVGERIWRMVDAHPRLRGLTRTQVAKEFGISYQAMQKWVIGTAAPSPRHQEKISDVLGQPPETFMHGVQYVDENTSGINLVRDGNNLEVPTRIARPVSRHYERVPDTTLLKVVKWRDKNLAYELDRFIVVMPDDSMEPILLEGAKVILDRTLVENVLNKDIVLIEDSSGDWYLRTYLKAPNGRWEGKPENSDYAQLDSGKDVLKIIAVFDGALGRRGR